MREIQDEIQSRWLEQKNESGEKVKDDFKIKRKNIFKLFKGGKSHQARYEVVEFHVKGT